MPQAWARIFTWNQRLDNVDFMAQLFEYLRGKRPDKVQRALLESHGLGPLLGTDPQGTLRRLKQTRFRGFGGRLGATNPSAQFSND